MKWSGMKENEMEWKEKKLREVEWKQMKWRGTHSREMINIGVVGIAIEWKGVNKGMKGGGKE